ncbi:MAG: hypothetical protein K2P43_01335, partial [Lachnospiraceae bacterium]|nr:hypothetical protein [Lachnospiraceae bacterium]
MSGNAIVCPEIIRKRNGMPAPFDVKKIRDAIRKANDAARVEAIAPYQFEKLVEAVVEAIPEGKTPDVEQIQDLVEEKLIENGFAKTAKAYILYRAEHTKVRKTEADLVKIYQAGSNTHLRAHETSQDVVCRLVLEKKKGGGG